MPRKCPVCASKKVKKVVAEKCLVCGNERDDVSGGVGVFASLFFSPFFRLIRLSFSSFRKERERETDVEER